MLRKIIAAYQAAFFSACVLLLTSALVGGFALMITGYTLEERWGGVSMMLVGSLIALVSAGNAALRLENNELLRRIVDRLEPCTTKLEPESADRRSMKRVDQGFQRREPTL